jgi:hypothetical protein
LLTRSLLALLGLAMIVIGLLWLAARTIARWFAPSVIVVERTSEPAPSPFPMTRAVIAIVALMLLPDPFGRFGPC